MTNEELINNLKYLIDKYIPASERERFYIYMRNDNIPVKGILADLNKYQTRIVDQADGNLIKDIYFYFC